MLPLRFRVVDLSIGRSVRWSVCPLVGRAVGLANFYVTKPEALETNDSIIDKIFHLIRSFTKMSIQRGRIVDLVNKATKFPWYQIFYAVSFVR